MSLALGGPGTAFLRAMLKSWPWWCGCKSVAPQDVSDEELVPPLAEGHRQETGSTPQLDKAGELTLVAWEQENRWTDQLTYLPGPGL